MRSILEVQRERLAPQHRQSLTRGHTLDGPALAREISAAIRADRRCQKLSESERDSLAAMLAERLYRRALAKRRGTARDVLAWIDWAERNPVSADVRQRVERGAVGRNLLAEMIGSLLAQSREWSDTCERYRLRERADRSGPTVTVESMPSDVLALARQREAISEGRPMILPADVAALADAFASRERGTGAQRRAIRTAFLAAAYGPTDLAAMLAAQGERRSIGALKVEATAGRKLIDSRYPTPDVFTERVGALADELAAWDVQAALEVGGAHSRPVLSRAALAARELLERIAPTTRAAEAASPASDGEPRVLPAPTAWANVQERPERVLLKRRTPTDAPRRVERTAPTGEASEREQLAAIAAIADRAATRPAPTAPTTRKRARRKRPATRVPVRYSGKRAVSRTLPLSRNVTSGVRERDRQRPTHRSLIPWSARPDTRS